MQRDIFHAIADPTRRKIIDLLIEKPYSVNEVAENFEISRPAVSKHLKILHQCQVIDIKKNGRKRMCRTNAYKLREVAEWAFRYREFWSGKLDTLEDLLNHDA